jgi:two-component system LytT family sensor kinase
VRLSRRHATTAGISRAEVLAELLQAEAAVDSDPGLRSLARHAMQLATADAAWLNAPRYSDAAGVVAAGHHHHRDREVAALLTAGVDHDDGNLVVRHLADGAAIGFVFDSTDPDLRLATAVASWVAGRLARRETSEEAARAARAELRALRAQISPHFIFNAMGAIAALIRIDPERARTLLLDFADYTRYSFGRHGEYTTFAEELRSTETYLSLERARFGERLGVRVTVAPEVLTVPVPFLVLQPLVENAVRHGVEPVPGGGRISVLARDEGSTIRVEIEDDGAGADPAALAALLAGDRDDGEPHVGLRNIDERLRATYGDAFGLIVDTAPKAGTKVTVRIPKYRPEVSA